VVYGLALPYAGKSKGACPVSIRLRPSDMALRKASSGEVKMCAEKSTIGQTDLELVGVTGLPAFNEALSSFRVEVTNVRRMLECCYCVGIPAPRLCL
jgi:hypothetical protein